MKARYRVDGYRETMRALNKMEDGTPTAVKAGLIRAAAPVAETARSLISRFPGASTQTISPRVSTRGVFVTQRARKVTGKRGDFGALQMREGMIPALEQHEDDVREGVEDAFDLLARLNGF